MKVNIRMVPKKIAKNPLLEMFRILGRCIETGNFHLGPRMKCLDSLPKKHNVLMRESCWFCSAYALG